MKYSKVVRLVDTGTGEETEIELQRIDTDSEFVTYCFKYRKDSENVPIAVHFGTPSGTLKSKQSRQKVSGVKRLPWSKLYSDAEDEKFSAAKITNRGWRVMRSLKRIAGWHGFVACTHQQIADKTGIARPHVTSAIKELIAADMIICIDRGRYRVNPSVYWKGSDEDHQQAVDQYYRHKKKAEKTATQTRKANNVIA